jgi:hypothetical protein
MYRYRSLAGKLVHDLNLRISMAAAKRIDQHTVLSVHTGNMVKSKATDVSHTDVGNSYIANTINRHVRQRMKTQYEDQDNQILERH